MNWKLEVMYYFRVPKVEGIVIKELEICILEKPEKLEKDRPSSVIRSDNYVILPHHVFPANYSKYGLSLRILILST